MNKLDSYLFGAGGGETFRFFLLMGEREGDRDPSLLLLLWGAGDQEGSLLSLGTGEGKLRRLAMGERERDLRLSRERGG